MGEQSITKWYGKLELIGYGIGALLAGGWLIVKGDVPLGNLGILVILLFLFTTGPLALYTGLTD